MTDHAASLDEHNGLVRHSSDQSALPFLLVKTIIVLTFTLSAPILNFVVPYSLPGGSALVKFHPATWIALLLWLSVAANEFRAPLHRHYARAAMIFFALAVWLLLQGKGSIAATLFDIHFSVAVLLLGFTSLSFDHARSAMAIFIWIAALNVLVVAFEFFTKTRVLPLENLEPFFRPAGLFGHPITSGMIFGCAMIIVSRGGVGPALVRPLMLLFLVGTALCGVRGPLAAANVIFLLNLIWPNTKPRFLADRLWDLGIALFLPVAIVSAWAIGAFDRILAAGLWENSAQSRFYIFEPLNWLSPSQFWNGIDDYGTMEYLARQATGGTYIENSFVAFVFSGGILMAILLGIAILYMHLPALCRSLSFIVIFLFFVAGTIGFSSKGQTSAAIALAGYWICRSRIEECGHA